MDASSNHQDTLPISSDALLEELRAQGIAFDYYEHIPLRTVEDAKTVQGTIIPQGEERINIKNLYLRDRKKRNHLIVLEQDRAVDLKALGASIGAPGLSFGSPDRLFEYLGVRPGAVSPLTMITGAKTGVYLHIDSALRDAKLIHAHPLVNDRTVALSPNHLETLITAWGSTINWLELGT